MSRPLRVWGLMLFVPTQERCIVAAATKTEAANLFGVSLHHFKGYGSETGNEHELRVALASPGQVFAAGDVACTKRVYRPISRRPFR